MKLYRILQKFLRLINIELDFKHKNVNVTLKKILSDHVQQR